MCGLVGLSSTKPDIKHKLILSELLVLSTFRGTHSAGLASMAFDGEPEILKTIGTPFNLFETKGYNDLSTGFRNVHIGHTRHATRGSITYNNAHPFAYGALVGAHNGTLTNEHELKKELTDKFGLDTDSQVLYAHMAEHGVRDTIPKTRGAWSLTWFDKFDERLYFLSNGDRPLWYCFNEEKDTVFWASEYQMLNYVLCGRHGITIWKDKKGFGFFPVDEDMLYCFDVSKPKKFNETSEVTLESKEELKGASGYQSMVATPFMQGVGSKILNTLVGEHHTSKQQGNVIQLPKSKETSSREKSESSSTETSSSKCQTGGSSTGSRTRKPLLSTATTDKDEALDDSLLYGPNGTLVSSSEFRSLTCNGCLWCSDPIDETESPYIRWVINQDAKGNGKSTNVLCPSCSAPKSEAMDNMVWITGSYGLVTDPVVGQYEENKLAL